MIYPVFHFTINLSIPLVRIFLSYLENSNTSVKYIGKETFNSIYRFADSIRW